jgi:hypothetical protein
MDMKNFEPEQKRKMIRLNFHEYEDQLPRINKACKQYKLTLADFIRISIERSLNTIEKSNDKI